jgi:hypothetical protein
MSAIILTSLRFLIEVAADVDGDQASFVCINVTWLQVSSDYRYYSLEHFFLGSKAKKTKQVCWGVWLPSQAGPKYQQNLRRIFLNWKRRQGKSKTEAD